MRDRYYSADDFVEDILDIASDVFEIFIDISLGIIGLAFNDF